jgi:uncharacterized membrane protein (DUF485 family)
MGYQESGVSIHRRRRRRRAAVTLTAVTLLLFGTFVYAAVHVQELVGATTPGPTATATCHGVTTTIVTPSLVTVNVYNATSRDGLAASVAESLQKLGFNVDKVGNDPLSLSVLGVAEIRRGPAGDAGAALTARLVPGAKVVPDERTDDTVDIVLGNTFTRLSAPPQGARFRVARTTPAC